MIVTVPAVTPWITPMPPEAVVAVAMAGLLLLHVPPSEVSIKEIFCPAHTLSLPSIGDMGLTMMVVNTEQPEPSV